jgi:hypothetical protein
VGGVTMNTPRKRPGSGVDDLCRVCKSVRHHTVVAADGAGQVLRVLCDTCGSQHNYRGGASVPRPAAPLARRAAAEPSLVDPRERSHPPMSHESGAGRTDDLELLLRRIIREEAGLTAVSPAEKWRGGDLVLRPGKEGLQEKVWPIDGFFHKIVMIRNRLRTLEQQVNAVELPEDVKVKLQTYITACYGSLTSFNVLFADEKDRFTGSGGT